MGLIQTLLDFLHNLRPHLDQLVEWNVPGFYAVMFLIVFAETGLVVTPFLPGDSLLFLLGAMATPGSSLSLPLLFVLVAVAAVAGDAVNYHVGHYLGPKVFRYENSWLLHTKHLLRAQAFYERYGSKTIILARFVPIVRTFAPFVAGIGKMTYRKFVVYNVVGGLAWVAICLGGGRLFGEAEWVKEHFELVLVAIVAISVMPMVVEYFLARRRNAAAQKPVAGSDKASGARQSAVVASTADSAAPGV
jgi:membrane-associated protein